ncbi:MAG: T9SS C-terminal target domain-containing protein [Bacteroidetes bacterium]|nr:MAG: T9SS C-terminal target domain-containing protein [Bacteroidota bacterium]
MKNFTSLSVFITGLIACFLIPHTVFAQRHCHTQEYIGLQLAKDPGLAARMAEQQRQIAEYLAHHDGSSRFTDTVFTIPVVVHVVYNTPDQNISDAQVLSQIDVLNEDFRKLNADTTVTPGPFKSLAGDIKIEFCLANFDPQGLPTTGITRTQTTNTEFALDNSVKFTAQGGHDAWPYQQYLNMWSCPLTGGILGYSSGIGFGGDPAVDGVVMGYQYFGRVGNVDPQFGLGRTATHEIGHWLGLRHIWSDDNDCATDDGISDTPPHLEANFGCKTFPYISCNNGPNGDMFVNYMDYSDDACLTMFTKKQSAVMRSKFDVGGERRSLLTSGGCINPLFNDAGIDTLLSPGGILCGGTGEIKAVLKNYGKNFLTSAIIKFYLDGTLLGSYTWTGSLDSNETAIIIYPVTGVTPGPHVIEAVTASPNSSNDPDQGNNGADVTFQSLEHDGLPIPYAESFEGANYPPVDWTLLNPDNNIGWQKTTAASYTGAGSVFMDNFNYSAVGQVDEFVVTDLDITPFPHAGLAFRLAYAQFGTNTGFADTLEVWVSGDCGITYKRLYKKYGAALATVAPVAGPFVPNKSQWREEWVDLIDFAGNNGIKIKFRHTTNYENNLYIDDINIVQLFTLGADPVEGTRVSLVPNPARDHVQITLEGWSAAAVSYQILDVSGREVAQGVWSQAAASHEISTAALPRGLYLVRLSQENRSFQGKLMLE